MFFSVGWGGNNFLISWTVRPIRPNFRFSGGGGSVCVVFFWARKTTLFSKEWTNILHPFQGNLHKGRLHCGLWKSNCLLKNTLSQRCYLFCKEHYTSSNGNSMHCAFLQTHHPLSKGLLYIWKCSLLYNNLNHTILSRTLSLGLLCVLKATFSKGCYILLKGILRVIVYIYIQSIISYSELCYLKIILYFPNEKYFFELISLLKSMFHEAIKYCLKGMLFFWKTLMYMHILS